MKVTPEFLASDGLLLNAGVLPLPSDPEEGLHYGVFAKSFFTDICEFRDFTCSISALAQPWYASKDLQEALSWSAPEDSSVVWAAVDPWVGHLRELLPANNVCYPCDAIPEILGGGIYWDGNADFGMAIDSPHGYIDVFMGCIVL